MALNFKINSSIQIHNLDQLIKDVVPDCSCFEEWEPDLHEEDDDAHDDEEEGVGVEHQDLQALLGGQVGLGVGVTAAVADISGLHDGKEFLSDTR